MATNGAGAWKSPKFYGLGMVLPDDERGRMRAKLAMKGIQKVLIDQGLLDQPARPLDGGVGPLTDRAIKAHQKHWGLPQTGKFAKVEAFCLWFPILFWWQNALQIPDNLLTGMIGLESAFDPGAEGFVDPRDRGVGQFSSRWWPNVSDEMAFADPAGCIALTAHNLKDAYDKLGSWDAAVASHNNPANALQWSNEGKPPNPKIERYVYLVRQVAGKPV